MKRIFYALIGCLLLAGSFMLVGTAEAKAEACVGSWSVGIGGLSFPDPTQHSIYLNTNHRVAYNSWDARNGIDNLNGAIWHHRNMCPGDHIEIIGHSQGAALAHVWVTEHQDFPNANAVLLADPKRAAGPAGPGMASLGGFLGYPLAGTDNFFGGFPVLTICRWDDWVCNLDAPWGQSHATGSHGAYPADPWLYDDWGSGVWMW